DDSTRNAYYSYVWQLDEATRTQYLASLQSAPEKDSLSPITTQTPAIDYYSYAGEKNVPWRVKGRTKYGVVKYEPYWLKKYRMRTAPMENVYSPKPPEPVRTDYVATETTDSVAVDSLGVASLDSLEVDLVALEEQAVAEEEEPQKYLHEYDPQDNFNVEQEYYNKYYGEKLIDRRPKPKVQATQAADSLATAIPDSLQDKKFSFKGLFRKKENEPDSTQVIPAELEVEDTGND
ncbi:MAG: hypothetical protein ABJP45_17015, partial [Cyclobacteriaceae bacterium]